MSLTYKLNWSWDVIGAVESERECNNPKPSDVLHRCEGSSVKAAICDDAQLCGGKTRLTPVEFAGQQCVKFSKQVPFIDPKGTGMQATYSDSRCKVNFIKSFVHKLRLPLDRTAMAIVRNFLQTKRPRRFLHSSIRVEQFAGSFCSFPRRDLVWQWWTKGSLLPSPILRLHRSGWRFIP
jgi:hypothetical protein